jgi:hypothetical protein
MLAFLFNLDRWLSGFTFSLTGLRVQEKLSDGWTRSNEHIIRPVFPEFSILQTALSNLYRERSSLFILTYQLNVIGERALSPLGKRNSSGRLRRR